MLSSSEREERRDFVVWLMGTSSEGMKKGGDEK
jgi:hypothetical protein